MVPPDDSLSEVPNTCLQSLWPHSSNPKTSPDLATFFFNSYVLLLMCQHCIKCVIRKNGKDFFRFVYSGLDFYFILFIFFTSVVVLLSMWTVSLPP